jgi:hypothetical protein
MKGGVMSTQNHENNTAVYLSTSTEKNCVVCHFDFHAWYDIARQINHYLDHSYIVRHVGQETFVDDNHQAIHSTVAVLIRK